MPRHAAIRQKKSFLPGLLILFVTQNTMIIRKIGRTYSSFNDGDGCAFGKGGRTKAGQIAQKIKKTTCSIETGMTSSFAVRGLTLDTRIKIIELVQFEDSKVMEQFNQRILHLTT